MLVYTGRQHGKSSLARETREFYAERGIKPCEHCSFKGADIYHVLGMKCPRKPINYRR